MVTQVEISKHLESKGVKISAQRVGQYLNGQGGSKYAAAIDAAVLELQRAAAERVIAALEKSGIAAAQTVARAKRVLAAQ